MMMMVWMVDLVADLDYSVPSMLHFQEGEAAKASNCDIHLLSHDHDVDHDVYYDVNIDIEHDVDHDVDC